MDRWRSTILQPRGSWTFLDLTSQHPETSDVDDPPTRFDRGLPVWWPVLLRSPDEVLFFMFSVRSSRPSVSRHTRPPPRQVSPGVDRSFRSWVTVYGRDRCLFQKGRGPSHTHSLCFRCLGSTYRLPPNYHSGTERLLGCVFFFFFFYVHFFSN